MKRHEIEIIVDLEGSVSGTVVGIKGKSCHAITDIFSEIGHIKSAAPTSEYYQGHNLNQTITCRSLKQFSEF
jgi:hypothetical protein